jgi:membrane-associated phospholipid phosphatase
VPLVRSARDGWELLGARYPRVAAVLPGVALLLLGLAAFLVTLDSVQEQDDLMVVDEPVLTWLAENRHPVGDTVLHAVTLISGPVVLPFLVAAAAVVWGIYRRRWWRPLLLLASMAVASLLALAVKRGVARPRPPLDSQFIPGAETSFSFPSGHTIVTAALCLVGGYLAWSRQATVRRFVAWVVGTVVATTAVGLSRLYLGYHFVTDVVGAVGLAVVVLALVVMLDRYQAVRRSARPPPAGPGRR